MLNRFRLIICLLILGAAFVIGLNWPSRLWNSPDKSSSTRRDEKLATATNSAAPAGALNANSTAAPKGSPGLGLTNVLQNALEQLRLDGRPESSTRILQGLREEFMAPDRRAEAARALLDFLATGGDHKTDLAFRVGPNHALTEAPTLRAAALDWLGILDPSAAAGYATTIFEAMSSPEEYALALRNFAAGRPNERAELRRHFEALLNNTTWASHPTAGYLESFDVVPHLGDARLIKPLAEFLASDRLSSLRHASMLALDRLVLTDPAGSLRELLDSQALKDQPFIRASFFARADVRNPIHCQLIERYLLGPELSDPEIDKFTQLFPNANGFASYSLFTEPSALRLADLADQDAATLKQIRLWAADARFSRWSSRFKQIENRVQRHVESALRAGYLPSR